MRKILAYSDHYTRVRKDVARRLYQEGMTIYLTPSNIAARDSNFWIKPIAIKQGDDEGDFDQQVNSFEYYNCNNHKLGYYTNFWIDEEEIRQ